jgi:hypothetical protein
MHSALKAVFGQFFLFRSETFIYRGYICSLFYEAQVSVRVVGGEKVLLVPDRFRSNSITGGITHVVY